MLSVLGAGTAFTKFSKGANLPPGKPTASVTTAGPNSAALSWTAPSPGTSPITGYLVHYRQTGMTIWVSWPHTGTTTTTTVTGLTSGRTYEFQVVAFSAVGSGAFSDAVSTQIPAISIPTLNEWGFIGLLLLLRGVGYFSIRRKNQLTGLVLTSAIRVVFLLIILIVIIIEEPWNRLKGV